VSKRADRPYRAPQASGLPARAGSVLLGAVV
jgi:hypothetical protein